MPQRTKIEISKFNKGLITEAGPLTFPDDASLVDENFVLLKDGSRKRRLGLDYEDDHVPRIASDSSDEVEGVDPLPIMASHMWKNPTQTGSFDIVVVHADQYLYFYNSKAEPISGTPIATTVGPIDPISLPADYVRGTSISVASIRGQLVVTFGGDSFLVLTYDEETEQISASVERIKVRDVWGIESIYDVDERPAITPTTLVDDTQTVALDADLVQHVYNLRNQGWPSAQRTSISYKGTAYHETYDTILLPEKEDVTTITEVNYLVSDADIAWRSKTSSTEEVETIGLYSPFEVYKNFFGATPAPKGKAIIDLFDRATDRQAFYDKLAEESEMVIEGDSIVSDSATGVISQVASYAGRVFFSIADDIIQDRDNRSPRLSNLVFFSQVVDKDENIYKCYQESDPTSEYDYDVLDTDGGFVSLPEAGKIVKLAPLGNSLFVITTNGVWEIHGGEQVFSATNQNVTKTSNIGALSSTSVVVSDAVITYFTVGGIYAINIDPSSLRGVASNITADTIASYYIAIPAQQKVESLGVFDEVNRKLRWLFSTQDYAYPRIFDRELVFDIDLSAFYVNTFVAGEEQIGVKGYISIPEIQYFIVEHIEEFDIYYGFGDFKRSDFKDFGINDAKATLVTGYLTGETGSSAKQIKSLIVHCKRTETGYELDGSAVVFSNPSGCTVTPQWEWTNSATAGRWNTPFQAYRLTAPYYPEDVDDPFDYSYTVITTRTGLRGKGRALSLKFESQEEKDLHLLGWGLEVKVDEQFA